VKNDIEIPPLQMVTRGHILTGVCFLTVGCRTGRGKPLRVSPKALADQAVAFTFLASPLPFVLISEELLK